MIFRVFIAVVAAALAWAILAAVGAPSIVGIVAAILVLLLLVPHGSFNV